MKSPIYIASDHAGFELKCKLINALGELNFIDLGTDTKDSVDYPDFAHRLTQQYLEDNSSKFAILICGSGQGMVMTANKYPGARAALCTTIDSAKTTREHNDANILCLGERVVDFETAKNIVTTFLNTPFEGGRH